MNTGLYGAAKVSVPVAASHALSDPTRRRVLQLLRQRPMSAGISDRFQVSMPTMSAHFAVLKDADLIHAENVGKSILYHLKLSVLEDALMGFIASLHGGDPDGQAFPFHAMASVKRK